MTDQIPNLESLGKRIEKLERQNLIMKWAAALIFVALIMGTVAFFENSRTQSQTKPSNLAAKTIQAESFDLVSGGKIKARLTHDASETSLILNDEQGDKRLAIGVAFRVPFGGPYLEMFPAEGQMGLNSRK